MTSISWLSPINHPNKKIKLNYTKDLVDLTNISRIFYPTAKIDNILGHKARPNIFEKIKKFLAAYHIIME